MVQTSGQYSGSNNTNWQRNKEGEHNYNTVQFELFKVFLIPNIFLNYYVKIRVYLFYNHHIYKN